MSNFPARRYSHQNGYPVDYPVSREMESVTDYQDRIITHVVLASRYYQFYCDRNLVGRVNTIGEFRSLVSRGGYTKYVALDLGSFSAENPGVKGDLVTLTEQNRLAIDPGLLDYLTKHYPSDRRSFLLVFDLTREKKD